MSITKPLGKVLQDYFLYYFNMYLTIDKFAEHHELTNDEALRIMEIGKEIHERKVSEFKQLKELNK